MLLKRKSLRWRYFRGRRGVTSDSQMVSELADVASDNAPPSMLATTGSIKRKLTMSIRRTFRDFRIHPGFRRTKSFHEASESMFDLLTSQNDTDASNSRTGHSHFLTNGDVDLIE